MALMISIDKRMSPMHEEGLATQDHIVQNSRESCKILSAKYTSLKSFNFCVWRSSYLALLPSPNINEKSDLGMRLVIALVSADDRN